MKLFSTTTNLLATSTCYTFAQAHQREIAEGSTDHHQELDPRQAKDFNQNAKLAATQGPFITRVFMQVPVGTTVSYKAVVVTQTFAKVPDQWPAPGSGVIGYGSLMVVEDLRKREAEPTAGVGFPVRTDIPVVIEVEEVGVTEWIQLSVSITEVRYEVVGILGNATNSTLLGSQMVLSDRADVTSSVET